MQKVFVGLSGGVDSGVTAALLRAAGAQVSGVFIKGWYPPGMPCTWADDRRDAMRVAAHLGIAFHTLEADAEYKKGVIDYLLNEYRAGRTPNPDIMCNREVKFGAFFDFAKAHGADFIATGHYARVGYPQGDASLARPTQPYPSLREHPLAGSSDVRLMRGSDESKDQSYFLWAVPQEALAQTLFPLGAMQKTEVRALAKKFKLPVAEKKDSQGICFLGSISVDEFLRREFDPVQGIARDENGKEIGRHDGTVLYTLGARIPLHNAPPGPWYVIKKDIQTNELTVSHELLHASPAAQLTLRDTNWFAKPEGSIEAQYRYHGARVRGRIEMDEAEREQIRFIPSEPIAEPIASGQSLVIYRDDECLGGGIIA